LEKSVGIEGETTVDYFSIPNKKVNKVSEEVNDIILKIELKKFEKII